MISRTYIVEMPADSAVLNPMDILVTNDPGTQGAPVLSASGGAYYEVLGRSLRVPVLAAQGQSQGFVPRLRLGYSLSIVPISPSNGAVLPGVKLSASLASLASTDGGLRINVPAFPDPSGMPSIRLTGSADTDGAQYIVSLLCVEAKDVDREGTGI